MEPQQNDRDSSSPAPLPEPVRPGRISIWRVLGTLLSFALVAYLVSSRWSEFTEMLTSLPPNYIWIALGLMMLSRFSVALRWHTLLHFARVNISFGQSLRLVFMGLFASNFLPSTVGGDVVRLAGALSRRIEPGVATASLVIDRLIGMAGMASLAPVGLAIVLGAPASTGALSMGVFSGLFQSKPARWALKKLKKFLGSMWVSSMTWLRNPASIFLALLCTFAHMLFTFLIIRLLLQGMGQPLSFWWIAGLWSLSYFITLVPVSINGLGVQELSISLLYSHFGGVSTEASVALALFMRMLPMLASLPGALFLPEILRPTPAPQTPTAGSEPPANHS